MLPGVGLREKNSLLSCLYAMLVTEIEAAFALALVGLCDT